MKHAFLSASGAPAWLICQAKPWREKDVPEVTSKYAAEGTEAHELLEHAIKEEGYLQREDIKNHPAVPHIETTLSLIADLALHSDTILSEQRLSISHITGEKGAQGTADVVILGKDSVVIIDLKYGKGIRVHAEDNTQLLIYGAAALKKYGKDKKTLHMLISQPRLNHISEWILTKEEVSARVKEIKVKAKEILTGKGGDPSLLAVPGTKQCQFCKVKAECPERASWLEDNPVAKRIKKQVEELIFPDLNDEEYIEAAIGLSLEN